MEQSRSLPHFKQFGTGLCLVVFPLVWIFAFVVHPNLLSPQFLMGPEELIWRAHGNNLLQFAHVLVTLNTALLVPIALHFMKLLDRTPEAWAGLLGATIAILGACLLAADKGALCLAMSAFDQLTDKEFAQMMPGLIALFSFRGWMIVVWGLVLMPIGVILQTVVLLKAKVLPSRQLGLQLAGVAFVGFPDGAEIVNLAAASVMAASMVPYGLRLMSSVRSA